MRWLETLKQLVADRPRSRPDDSHGRRRRDPQLTGSKRREIDSLPPERAAELAGHAPERVDT